MKTAFIIVICCWVYGAVGNSRGASVSLALSWLAILIFVVIAIVEIASSEKARLAEKVLWVIALVFFNILSCAVYYLVDWRREFTGPHE